MAEIRERGEYPATVVRGTEVSLTVTGPVVAAKTVRRKRAELALVERTDRDAQYDHVCVAVEVRGINATDPGGVEKWTLQAWTIITEAPPVAKAMGNNAAAPIAECDLCGAALRKRMGVTICTNIDACPSNADVRATEDERQEVKAAKKVPAKKVPAKKVPAKKVPAKKVPAKLVDAPAAPEAPATVTICESGAVVVTETQRTREDWLRDMTTEMRPLFQSLAGVEIPAKVRVSCGWPSQSAMGSKRRVGECWAPEASADQTCEIFISPVIADGVEAAGILAHELVHAAVGNEAKHGPIFKRAALLIGLEGKMTSTTVGETLTGWITGAVAKLGIYPHTKLDRSGRKKDTTRLLKVVCLNDECEFLQENDKRYVVRMSATTLDYGAPKCGCCNDRMAIEEKSDEE